MGRRRKTQLDDSFDLFLDTITNTFGGVLLIALLIVLMIRESKNQAPQDFQGGPTEALQLVQSEIDNLESEKSALADSVLVHQELKAEFQNEEVAALAQTLSQISARKFQLEHALNQCAQKISDSAQTLTGIETNQSEMSQQLVETENDLKNLNEELDAEQQKRIRSIPLPKEKSSFKSEVAMIFDNHELFVVAKKNPGGLGETINRDHFKECSSRDADLFIGGEYIRTKPGAGVRLDDSKLKKLFAKYDPKQYHMTFVVRTNSFREFAELRQSCVENGFEYRIIATDSLISEGHNSGAKTQ